MFENAVSNPSNSLLVLDAIEVVVERLLEPVPIQESVPVSVQGRLYERAEFWLNELNASSFVREIVTQGYRIPFLKLPWPVFKCNHRSALEHSDFVSSAIQELVDSGCVLPTGTCPIVCSPLSVVVNAKGKRRLVLDLTSSSRRGNLSMKAWAWSLKCLAKEIISLPSTLSQVTTMWISIPSIGDI